MRVDASYKEGITTVGYVLVAILLFLSAFRTNQKEKGCPASKATKFADRPFLVGVLTGINLCPPFLGAVVSAVDISGPWAGMLVFTAFFAGSTIWLLPVFIFGVLGSKKFMRTVAVFGSVIVGAWFLGQAANKGWKFYQELNPPEISANTQVVSLFDGRLAYLLVDDSTTYASFVDTLHKVRKGPTFVVHDTAALRGQCYVFASAEWLAAHRVDPLNLKVTDRFVVVLPPLSSGRSDSAWIGRITGFLGGYSFKLADTGGTLFNMAHELK